MKRQDKNEEGRGAMSWEAFGNLLGEMAEGSLVSLSIFFLTLLFSLPLGLLATFGEMSRFKVVQIPVKLYILVMRGTPLHAPALLCILRAQAAVRHPAAAVSGGHHRFCAELRRLFC